MRSPSTSTFSHQIKRVSLLVFLLTCSGVHSLFSQNYSEYNWLFGSTEAHMTFNKSDARVQLDSLMATGLGTGGGVSISDPVTGDILFYTDGVTLYDANHTVIPGVLNGNNTINRAAVVMPMPYTNGQYYIFTNSGNGGVNEIQYTVVDKNFPGNAGGGAPPLGDISLLNQATGLTNPSDAMLMVQDISVPTNFWLISQERTSLDFRVTRIQNGVIGATTLVNPWTVSEPAFEIADLAYNSQTQKLAAAPKESNRNVTLFDFGSTAGNLLLDRAILNTGNADFATEAVYGVEWSSTGNQLYISRHGGAGTEGNLYQYDMNDSLNTVNQVLFAPVFRSYGVKLGPDQRIYHLYQLTNASPIEVGVINIPDSTFNGILPGFGIQYDSLVFTPPSNLNATQFPDFPAPHFETFDFIDIFVSDTCVQSSTKFYSSVSPTPESYLWDFGDGVTSNAVSPVHTYMGSGAMTVRLSVTLNGITETNSRAVEIVTSTFSLDLGMDTVRCPGEVWQLDAGGGGVTYSWNTGESTQSIDADTTNVYSVSVLTPEGCMVYDYVQITTYEDTNEFRNQWYFGEQAGIDFNLPVSPIEDTNLINSPQAASSVSDLNGTLRFYTDGETIWNWDHEIMLNGDNIGGDNSSMQGVMIVPLPGDTSVYYVFTTDPVWGDFTYDMKYSVVDMKQDTARGRVMAKDMTFMKNSTERLAGFGLGNIQTWLITHEYGNNQFRSYPITDEGIGAPLTSAAGSVMRFDEEKTGTGEMQVAQAGGVLAVAFQETNENFVEIFDINDTTGVITHLVTVDLGEPTPNLVYGLEFSPGISKLYVSTNGGTSRLFQYDLDSLYGESPRSDIENSKFELGSNAGLQYGALATGSDGIIYMAVDSLGSIGTISNPSGEDDQASFVENGFNLGSRISRLGLPNFVQSIPQVSMNPGISISNTCLGQPTILDGSGTSNIDNFFWTFGDGTFAVVEDTLKTYAVSGAYDVSLNITNRCGLDTTFLETISIDPIPVEPTLQDNATLCNGPVLLEAWPRDTAEFSYTWSTGQTTRQITINQASIVSVFITDTTGCQSDPRFSFIDDTSPVVNLGPDQSICQGAPVFDLNALNPGSSFTWAVNGVLNGNTLSVQTVDTSVPGSYTYRVEVEDIFNCITIDSVTYNIQNMPDLTYVGNTTSGCGTPNGSIDIDLIDPGSFTYSLTGPTNIAQTPLTGPTLENVGPLLSGGYTVEVSNILTGCSNTQTVNVADGMSNYAVDNVATTPACPGAGELEVLLSGGPVISVDYELYDDSGNLILPGSATIVGNTFRITALDSGIYNLVVQDQGGFNCIQSFDNINLSGLANADYLSEPQFYCDVEGRIGITPVTTNPADPIEYLWNGPNIVGTAIGDSINVASPGTYTVTSNGTGFCSVATDITVTQNDGPDVVIEIVGAECDGQVILAANINNTIVGNTSYRWEDGTGTQQRRVTNSGTYEVLVLDQGSGCTGVAAEDVTVFDELTVLVTSSPNCESNGEVIVSAIANIQEDVTFEWIDPSGGILESSGAQISISEGGLYTVNVASTTNICTAAGAINVMVVPIEPEELLLTDNESFCSEDPDPSSNFATLDPGNFSSYQWSLVNSEEIISNERLLTVTEEGVYQVRLTNGFTCVNDFIDVRDTCLPVVYAPTAFTPDGNGLNDEFFVYENPYVSNFNIKIFSRWGEMVYQADGVDFRWNGVYEGRLLQSGTYVYVMTFESLLSPEDGLIVQRGGITIIR